MKHPDKIVRFLQEKYKSARLNIHPEGTSIGFEKVRDEERGDTLIIHETTGNTFKQIPEDEYRFKYNNSPIV